MMAAATVLRPQTIVSREHVEHYRLERNHQGLGNALIAGAPARIVGAIRRRPRMGGLLNYYERAA